MKIFPFLLSLWITSAFAQDDSSWEVNHYEHTRTFVEEGYTYQCDIKHGYVTLYNKDNKWTYADQIDKRTGKIYTTNRFILRIWSHLHQWTRIALMPC